MGRGGRGGVLRSLGECRWGRDHETGGASTVHPHRHDDVEETIPAADHTGADFIDQMQIHLVSAQVAERSHGELGVESNGDVGTL
jgi:hypothetical protein